MEKENHKKCSSIWFISTKRVVVEPPRFSLASPLNEVEKLGKAGRSKELNQDEGSVIFYGPTGA